MPRLLNKHLNNYPQRGYGEQRARLSTIESQHAYARANASQRITPSLSEQTKQARKQKHHKYINQHKHKPTIPISEINSTLTGLPVKPN